MGGVGVGGGGGEGDTYPVNSVCGISHHSYYEEGGDVIGIITVSKIGLTESLHWL